MNETRITYLGGGGLAIERPDGEIDLLQRLSDNPDRYTLITLTPGMIINLVIMLENKVRGAKD